MQTDNRSKGGLNELLAVMLHSENKGTPYRKLKQLLHRIGDDATEIYHARYGSYDTIIKFNINTNGKESDITLVGDRVLNRLNVLENPLKKSVLNARNYEIRI